MEGVTSKQLEDAYREGYELGGQKDYQFKEELQSATSPESLFMEKHAEEIRIPARYKSSSNMKVCFQYGVFDRVMGNRERTSKRVSQFRAR